MIDNTPLIDVVAWVEALTARGVALRVKGKRLEWLPGSAYKEMSDAEHATYRHHKAAIINVVRERHGGLARPASWASAATEPLVKAVPTADAVQPTPTPCPQCYHAPCIGIDHEHFRLLHPNAPEPPRGDLRALVDGPTLRDTAFSHGLTADRDDPTEVMLHQLRMRRR